MLLPTNPHRILLPRFDTFGDIVIFEAFVAALRDLFPNAQLCLLVRNGYGELSSLFPASTALQWLTVNQQAYVVPTETSRSDFLAELNNIAVDKWDAIIFTAYNRTWLDDSLLTYFTDVQTIILGSHSDVLTLSSVHCSVVPVEESIHESEKYRSLLDNLIGSPALLHMPQLEIPQSLVYQQREVAIKMKLEGQRYVVCLPAGTHNQKYKVWPLKCYVEVLCWLAESRGFVPLIVGHVSEEAHVRSLVNLLDSRGVTAYLWLGQDGEIPMLGAMLQKAELYIGSDSGPMHIAAALGVPTVGVFGGGHGFRFLPVGNKAVGVAAEIPCYGCHWNCIFGDAPCVRLVDVDSVIVAINQVLGEEPLSASLLNVGVKLPESVIDLVLSAKKEFYKRECAYFETIKHERMLGAAMQGSLSWRLTVPFRVLFNLVKRLI